MIAFVSREEDMKKSNKLTAVYALIMDLPLSIVITIIALALGGNLSLSSFIPSCILAYVVTFFVNFIHAEKWGFAFASKHAKPGTFKFGLLLNLVVAAVFVVILDLIMTYFGVIIQGGGTMSDYWKAVIGGFIPCYVPTLIIAMFWNNVADKWSRQICNEPAPEMPDAADQQ